jgi:DNA-binding response OmpR family regulator
MGMKHQVIVADDSQTIQKVISITLASEPFDIVECLDVKNLNNLVSTNGPKIVLLDFNLSEDKTGYDLCKEIKEISSDTSVVFLFGTFDIIDEDLIDQCGASNWIVKPFDGNKFINLCRSIIDNDTSSPVEISIDETEEWVMDVPSKIEDEPSTIESIQSNTLNVLENSMQDWGIEIPGVIGQESQNFSDIPNVIGSVESKPEPIEVSKVQESQSSDDNLFPESSDLEYPEIIEFEQKPTVELTPIDDLKFDEPEEIEIENKLFSSNSSETDVESLKEQIEDEAEDLWQLDQDDSLVDISSSEGDDNLNVHVLHDTPADFPTDVMDESDSDTLEVKKESLESESIQTTVAQTLNTEEILDQLRPMIEELVKAECKKIAEKVSWEIIPDLAENLIKDELSKISNQVLDQ